MDKKLYRLRGTADSPISIYTNMHARRFSHRHPEVELMLMRAGTVHCRVEDREVILRQGDIFILNPNQLHTAISSSEDHTYLNVIFSLEAIAMPKEHLFQRSFVSPLADGRLLLPSLLQPEHPAYKEVRTAMEQLPEGNPYDDETKIFRYARIVSICAALQPYCTPNQAGVPHQSTEDLSVRKVMTYIHFYYSKPLTLNQLADYVHLHPNYLCKLFKSYTGSTVMEHLFRTRVDAAKFLLRRDALPMARVAELTGFSSERAFYRQFHKFTGTTPKAYQKQQLQLESLLP